MSQNITNFVVKDICISVITICRNAEEFIQKTMLSVLEQTYQNIEYVIIDGQSTDRTLQIIHQTASQFFLRDIKIISEADDGIADAMNKGILISTGDIIIHLHAGDSFIDKTVINKVIETYISSPWRWAISGSVVVDKKGNKIHIYLPLENPRMLVNKNFIPHQSTFIVRDIFEKHGMFRVDMKQAMDYEYWLRIVFAGGEHFTVLPFNTTYFLNGGQSSKIGELLKYLVRTRTYLRSWGVQVSLNDDFIFFVKILVFWCYMQIFARLQIKPRRL